MDLRNNHNVYILGAGFSRGAGLPLMNDFLVRMRDSHEWLIATSRQREADAVQRVLEFRLKAASAAYYVSLDLENIEELFSLAAATEGDMDISIRIAIAATIDFVRTTEPLGQYKMFVTDSTRKFDLFTPPALMNVAAKHPAWAKPVGDINQPGANPEQVGPFQITKYAFHVARLLGLFLKETPEGENTFITFNYDTLLEDALAELKLSACYAFGTEVTTEATPRQPNAKSIPVLKLHGSVNWGRGHLTSSGRRTLKTYPNFAKLLADKAEPTIVPPTWKKVFGGPLEAVWDAAVQRLATATRIVIIGFSIPPTDMHFKYLLAAGLQKNVSLRQILFVNPDENQLRQRAEALLRKSYIDSRIIDFAKVGFDDFTRFNPDYLSAIGRPSQFGLKAELFPT